MRLKASEGVDILISLGPAKPLVSQVRLQLELQSFKLFAIVVLHKLPQAFEPQVHTSHMRLHLARYHIMDFFGHFRLKLSKLVLNRVSVQLSLEITPYSLKFFDHHIREAHHSSFEGEDLLR